MCHLKFVGSINTIIMHVHGWLQHAHAYTQHGFSLPRSVAKITDVFLHQTSNKPIDVTSTWPRCHVTQTKPAISKDNIYEHNVWLDTSHGTQKHRKIRTFQFRYLVTINCTCKQMPAAKRQPLVTYFRSICTLLHSR